MCSKTDGYFLDLCPKCGKDVPWKMEEENVFLYYCEDCAAKSEFMQEAGENYIKKLSESLARLGEQLEAYSRI